MGSAESVPLYSHNETCHEDSWQSCQYVQGDNFRDRPWKHCYMKSMLKYVMHVGVTMFYCILFSLLINTYLSHLENNNFLNLWYYWGQSYTIFLCMSTHKVQPDMYAVLIEIVTVLIVLLCLSKRNLTLTDFYFARSITCRTSNAP